MLKEHELVAYIPEHVIRFKRSLSVSSPITATRRFENNVFIHLF